MILQALNDYYRRLADDPDQDVAPMGFSRQKISFCVVLNADGSLESFQPVVSEVVKGRPLPESRVVPGQSKPTGAGINPCFLWDNATYMLGLTPDGRDPAWAAKRFGAFRDRHLAIEAEIDDEAFSSVCRFLEQWSPDRTAEHPELPDMAGSFGAFRLIGQEGFIHERPGVRKWWESQLAVPDENDVTGMCLVTGRTSPLARLNEPKIKGVEGTQSSGALMISFNLDAFTSYGKGQGYNAPTSQQAAFQYATGLNCLLADRSRRIQIGDATVVFWTAKPTPGEQILPPVFTAPPPLDDDNAEDAETLAKVRAFLNRLRLGKPDEAAGELGDPKTRYFLLGLSPNASRISVRFWLSGSLGDLAEHLARHVQALDIVGLDDRPPMIRELLRETAPAKSGWADKEKLPNPLSAAVARAVLTGGPYPAAFYAAILRRIRAEGFVTPFDEQNKKGRKDHRRALVVRAAALKACLNRNYRKEIAVTLDPNRPEPAYHLGRWFALLEKTQQDVTEGKLNATVKDRFYAAASATPAAVFPRLIQLSQHHLRKQEHTGLRITREKQLAEVADRLDELPRHLSLEAQGLFHLGYYHQFKDLWTKKPPNETNTETPENESE